jgi:hypothetical protein
MGAALEGGAGNAQAGAPEAGAVSCTEAPLLGSKPLRATGPSPTAVGLGDFDGDGELDLVVTSLPDTVGVLPGTGDGRFAARKDFTVGSEPIALAVGDLDANGTPDVVVANSISYGVSVLLGTGRGDLMPRADYATDAEPRALALGDLNADGKPDVVVVGWDYVNVLLGAGDGSLEAKVSSVTTNGPEAVAIADVNQDQKLDVVVATWWGVVSVFLGNGDGTLAGRKDYPADASIAAAAVGDIDGSAGADVVTLSTWADTVSVHLSTLTGGLSSDLSYPVGDLPDSEFPFGRPPIQLIFTDLSADGKLDLIQPNFYSGKLGVLLATDNASFLPMVDYATGGSPLAVAVGDLNGDEKPDLAAVNGDSATVGVLLGNGDGSFAVLADAPARTDHFVGGSSIAASALGDVDGDDELDLVIASYGAASSSPGEAVVLHGLGGGQFADGARYPIEVTTGMALRDVNGDDELDLLVANLELDSVSVWSGTGTGEFGPKADYQTGSGPRGVELGDLNGDGELDIVTPNGDTGSVSVLLGTGDGSFGSKIDYPTAAYPADLAIGDVDGDGKLDVVTIHLASTSVLPGLGDGTLALNFEHRDASGQALALGDLNADGKLDVVTLDWAGRVSILSDYFEGVLMTQENYVVGNSSMGVKLGDVTGDGLLDVVIVDADPGRVTVLPSTPQGISHTKLDYSAGSGADVRWLELGDFDGDGRVDLVFPTDGNTVSVLWNRCP